MSTANTPTRKQIVQQVLNELDGPALLDDVLDRFLQLRPSTAKNPKKSLRDGLRYDHLGHEFVFLDANTILPMHLALNGVRFRIKLDPLEIKHGMLIIRPAFDYFLQHSPDRVSFVDERGQPLPTKPVKHSVEVKEPLFGNYTHEIDAFDLREWFQAQPIDKKDDVLVTILDWKTACYRLEHEPERRRRKELISNQNRALANMLYTLLEESYDEEVMLHVAIPTAYARLPSARDYPGDHWMFVVDRDERMKSNGFKIMPADRLLPLERMFMDVAGQEQAPVRKKRFTREQGQQVYRFTAKSNHRKRMYIIEIQGKQTLGDFDGAMREAFDLDFFDHLSEFTHIVSRGKGKLPRKVDFGEIYPPGAKLTSAAKLRLAELGMEPGATLQYVYDFGDWIQHSLTLDSIALPEAGVEYPRILRGARSGKKGA